MESEEVPEVKELKKNREEAVCLYGSREPSRRWVLL